MRVLCLRSAGYILDKLEIYMGWFINLMCCFLLCFGVFGCTYTIKTGRVSNEVKDKQRSEFEALLYQRENEKTKELNYAQKKGVHFTMADVDKDVVSSTAPLIRHDP